MVEAMVVNKARKDRGAVRACLSFCARAAGTRTADCFRRALELPCDRALAELRDMVAEEVAGEPAFERHAHDLLELPLYRRHPLRAEVDSDSFADARYQAFRAGAFGNRDN